MKFMHFVTKRRISLIFACLLGLFHLLNISGILVLSTQIVRIIHLMAMLSLVFLREKKVKSKEEPRFLFITNYLFPITLLIISFITSIYIITRWMNIAMSGGLVNTIDTLMGFATILIIIEATRREVGSILSIIVCVFLIYPFVGHYLPGIFYARTYSLKRVVSFLYASGQGIYGIPIGVSATYIVLFCIYGAFLSEFGTGDFLYNISVAFTKNLVASSAKASVILSSLVGIISGSAAGNVAITGTLTIPMMQKNGYKAHESAAIVAVAATGGQIMPPVMGAAAFVLAEIIGLPYSEVMKAAFIPALLFYSSILIVSHFDELKHKRFLKANKTNKDEKIFLIEILKNGWFNIFPIFALIYLLLKGYSPEKAAFFSILILLIVVFINLITKREFALYEFVIKIINALEKGIKSTVPIAIACASAGIVGGVLSMSGLGSKFSSLILGISGGMPILVLFFTMIASIILGMGLPTLPAYLILVTVIAPGLFRLGIPLLTAHLFVFYFGCISTITPPVALASYVASGIANADINRASWTAFRLSIPCFIIPYMFYYNAELLLQSQSFFNILLKGFISFASIFSMSIAIVGYFTYNLDIISRLFLLTSSILMIFKGCLINMLGIVVLCLVFLFNRKNKSR